MKIAFVSTIMDYPWGGADFLWTRAAEAAAARGDRLLLAVSRIVAENPRVRELRRQGASVFVREKESVPASLGDKLGRRLRRWTGTADPLVNALRTFSPDLVVFSCGATYDLAYFPAWADWLLAGRTPFRLIANWQQEQPVLESAERERAIRVFNAADTLCFVSTRNLEITGRHLGQALPRARVVHNPLRWRETDLAPWPVAPPWNLATVSRLDAGKGVGLLLEAAARVLPRTSEWRLSIHGHGPEEAALRAQTARLDLQANVRFPGFVSELRAIWGTNHLLVSPSIEDGVPMTIPEALLCARPVLATAVGGTGDWVQPGVTGFVCSAPTGPQLAATLAEAFAARAQWQSMGRIAAGAAQAFYRPDDFRLIIA